MAQWVSVDSTVQPKAITHPTDAKLYLKALQALVRQAKRHGLTLRQAHTRLGKRAAVQGAAMLMPVRCGACATS